jgi:hypothetical protein
MFDCTERLFVATYSPTGTESSIWYGRRPVVAPPHPSVTPWEDASMTATALRRLSPWPPGHAPSARHVPPSRSRMLVTGSAPPRRALRSRRTARRRGAGLPARRMLAWQRSRSWPASCCCSQGGCATPTSRRSAACTRVYVVQPGDIVVHQLSPRRRSAWRSRTDGDAAGGSDLVPGQRIELPRFFD